MSRLICTMLVKELLSPCSIEILKCAEETPNPSHTRFPPNFPLLGMQKETRVPFLFSKFGARCTVFWFTCSRAKLYPKVSILNSEVWNRKFRNLGFEIPKLWIPKTAQDCCEKVNGTLDWGIPKILITSWIPKSEQFQKPLLPNKWLLIVSIPIFAVSYCMLIAPVSAQACEIPLQSQNPTFQCSTECSFHNGSLKKTRADLSPLSAKIGSQRYCLLVFSQLPVLSHSSDHSISSDHVCVTE